MDKLIRVEKKDNVLVVSSREIARNFDKEHYHVIEAIENKIENLTHEKSGVENLTTENIVVESYFIESKFTHRGNVYKEYLLTRDGFSFIVMGFTGSKADVWKLKYIDAFNKMENTIKQQQKQLIDLTKQHNSQARLKNAKVREAKLLLQIAGQSETPKEYKQILNSYAIEIITGKKLLPLPLVEEKTYTATEIAKELGVSANMVGRVANKNGLKTDKYGVEVWDKSRHSAKQVPSWRYNEEGKSEVIQLFKTETV